MLTRTLDLPAPVPAPGASWQARALLEAPSPDGPWTAIQAQGVATRPDGTDDPASLTGPLTSHQAQLANGWYRMQWHDDQRTSVFSEPVQLGGENATGSSGRGVATYGGRR